MEDKLQEILSQLQAGVPETYQTLVMENYHFGIVLTCILSVMFLISIFLGIKAWRYYSKLLPARENLTFSQVNSLELRSMTYGIVSSLFFIISVIALINEALPKLITPNMDMINTILGK